MHGKGGKKKWRGGKFSCGHKKVGRNRDTGDQLHQVPDAVPLGPKNQEDGEGVGKRAGAPIMHVGPLAKKPGKLPIKERRERQHLPGSA